jgi:ABC-type multidrug transport system permease subunit
MNEQLNTACLYLGYIVAGISSLAAIFAILFLVVKWIFNILGNFFPIMWTIVEFSIYKKDFMEWVKDKDRLKKSKK